MKVKELQTVEISPNVSALFAVAWSEDNKISVVTEKGVYILANSKVGHLQTGRHAAGSKLFSMYNILLVLLASLVPMASAGNITSAVFGSDTDGMPAAFGDFNSDDLTDMFILRGAGNVVEVLLASEQEPLFRPNPSLQCKFNSRITSVVPGNFDGDAHMDIAVTVLDQENKKTQVHVLWGGLDHINCSDESSPLFSMSGQPLAMDYNHDMIVDLFGEDSSGRRTFWLFSPNRTTPVTVHMAGNPNDHLRRPHSHAFLDWDGDFLPDLVLSTNSGYELWRGITPVGFEYNESMPLPPGLDQQRMGQSVFLDLELQGRLLHLVPVCYNIDCTNSSLLVHQLGAWHDLRPNLLDSTGAVWGWPAADGGRYTDTITLRAGDFNVDGYPDLLATVKRPETAARALLLENVPCGSAGACGGFQRTFIARWAALGPLGNTSVAGAFYDLYQDGVPDVLLAGKRMAAFRNTLDYDANFVKVMVLSGPGRGGNLPGPRVAYRTTTQLGAPQSAVAAQLPQSGHFALGLPYTVFGLGRTPNFVDALTVGVAGRSRDWTQIIPNSQVVVLLGPRWRAQLFVTPSKLVLLSAAALLATCGLIALIIAALYWKERREDRIEKMQESHKFHFDAM